jgi:hypothetical protein
MPSIKLYLKNFFILLITLLASLVAIELISEKHFNAKRKEAGQVEPRGYGKSIRLKLYPKNYTTVATPPSTLMENSNHSIEQKPYRIMVDKYQSLSAPSRNIREDAIPIFFLGGSTTESVFVDEEFRWPILSVKYANNNFKENYLAFNYGAAGNHLLHSTTTLFAYGRTIKPRIVVIKNLVNDLFALSRYGDYLMTNHATKSFFIKENRPAPTLFYFILELKNFFLPNTWELIKISFPNFQNKVNYIVSQILENSKEVTNNTTPKLTLDFTTPNGFNKIWEIYKHQMEELIALCNSNNIIPIVLIQGLVTDISADYFYNDKKLIKEKDGIQLHQFIAAHIELNNLLILYLRKNNIKFVDLRDLGTSQYMYDWMHYNRLGSIQVAKRVSKSIIRLTKLN